jgi:FkbM family methyltransferase
MFDYPSPVVRAGLPIPGHSHSVLIPENEIFRIHNIFQEQEYAIPTRYLPSGAISVVDIGANVGLFALFIKSVRSDCRVYCFEPAPHTIQLLQSNLGHLEDTLIYPYALSNHSGTAKLNIHPYNTGENSISRACHDFVNVAVFDAASVFRNLGLTYIDILKIDTEGSEVAILNSLCTYLPYVGIVLAEYHSESDRRAIDRILNTHTLFGSCARLINCGTVKYINNRLI